MSTRGGRIAVLVLAAVFAVGLLAGLVLEDVLDDLDLPVFVQEDDEPDGDNFDDDQLDDDVEEVLEGVDLTAEQRAEVEVILDRREDRLEAYWSERLLELRAIVDSSYAEIRAVLSPEQRAVLDRRLERIRAGVGDD